MHFFHIAFQKFYSFFFSFLKRFTIYFHIFFFINIKKDNVIEISKEKNPNKTNSYLSVKLSEHLGGVYDLIIFSWRLHLDVFQESLQHLDHQLRMLQSHPIDHFREQDDLPDEKLKILLKLYKEKRILKKIVKILTVCIAKRTPVAANGWPIDSDPPQLFHLLKSGCPTLPSKPI